MRVSLERTILTVTPCGGAWAVEQDGALFGHSPDKEVAKANAHKRAVEIVQSGGGAQVLIHGEGWRFR